ncbi:MAG: hypothetical protein K0S39_5448 [Paenibacillus sp.]|nr:hypothetical protein [Paenibacillus sp.]
MNVIYDWNEWFMIISSVVLVSLYLCIRKYFHPIITIIIWVYSVAFVETIDYFLVGSPFKLYYFSDNETYEPSAVLIHLTQYPCSSLLFLYFYDRWKLNGYKCVGYILIWNGIAIFYEWLCLINKVLTYTGWKLVYSIPTYPISSILLITVFHFTKKHLNDPVSNV